MFLNIAGAPTIMSTFQPVVRRHSKRHIHFNINYQPLSFITLWSEIDKVASLSVKEANTESILWVAEYIFSCPSFKKKSTIFLQYEMRKRSNRRNS